MNTIPIIFNERKVSHTIMGGIPVSDGKSIESLCVVVLSRGINCYRGLVVDELVCAGFTSIILMETRKEMQGIEYVLNKYPFVKVLFIHEPVTTGEMIDIAMAETDSSSVLVMWNDMHIPSKYIPAKILKKIAAENVVCAAPVLSTLKGEALPNQIVPCLSGNSFSTEHLACLKDKTATLYPYDFAGIYNRKKCIDIGGFDYSISNPYWQILDFGFRTFLWGESIRIFTSFRMQYETEPPTEDISIDDAYRRFYLKNLAPECKSDNTAAIPFKLFIPYWRKSGLNPVNAWQLFSAATKWVSVHKDRFKSTARVLVTNWEPFI